MLTTTKALVRNFFGHRGTVPVGTQECTMNGSMNGSSSRGRVRTPPKTKIRPSGLPWIPSARILAFFLGTLVVVTLVADTYFLSSTDFRLPKKVNSFLSNRKKSHWRAGASVEKPWTRRKFKFQDEKNPLPVLEKAKQPSTTSEATAGKEHILQIFKDAGIPPLNATMIQQLPTWEDIVRVIGPKPVVGGLDTCDAFKQKVPAVERMLGSSGMFNTGTNLVTHLLKGNCQIPERVEKYGPEASKEMHGMRWQVPWGKHSPAKYKEEHATEKAKAINKEWIMPVVTMRHPYSWMHSMCKNGYTAKWNHGRQGKNCPNLNPGGDWNGVTTKFADGRTEYSESLAHLWNDWYKMYIEDAKYPRIIVRLEDLVFHAKETTKTICECVGGKIRTDQPFKYVLDSAKADSRGHDTSTGFVQAWIKYSKPMPPRGGFTGADYHAAQEALNAHYMKMFHYNHPPPK